MAVNSIAQPLPKGVFTRLACVLLLVNFLFLTGCMTAHRKDGPPLYPVDETKVPNAVPKKEKLSRIGNKPYVVKGQKYFVMKSSKNFVQIGTASWYGSLFHDQRTSNGEKYDMLGMTAAHKTLPLPTYVQVTNLYNGRKVIVKVNDRGPFKPNRIIDLSYVAAKKLHMTGKGTALVEVRAIDTDPPVPRRVKERGSYARPLYLGSKNSKRVAAPHQTHKPHNARASHIKRPPVIVIQQDGTVVKKVTKKISNRNIKGEVDHVG